MFVLPSCDGAVPYLEQDANGNLVSACEGGCDDDDAFVGPAMPDLCDDDIDNDCSGEINEDCAAILHKGACAWTTSSPGGFGVALWLPILGWVAIGRRRAGLPI